MFIWCEFLANTWFLHVFSNKVCQVSMILGIDARNIRRAAILSGNLANAELLYAMYLGYSNKLVNKHFTIKMNELSIQKV